MAVPYSNTKLRVPKGFQNVLWVLTREVLREQPKNIVEFSARFLQKLLWIRCDTGHDPARHGAHSEDRYYNDYSYKESAAKVGGTFRIDGGGLRGCGVDRTLCCEIYFLDPIAADLLSYWVTITYWSF